MSDADKEFWITIRRGLIALAEAFTDRPDARRAILRMVRAIEDRYPIETK